ncbi:endonuclease/exonuclease/phosphatase family protein [Algicella marina]|uniref:Endonuclease/exonuclease/phosphatase domain-containing protein n=1 Tax=Algicella marina TaxID=2683284 RepID=A0A6P1SZ54_9RHOB|nr:endonuclease/exonuclease/phosphatase family protein [Algicella marina]QHQ34751.1 hypothetical protein GO499_05860 [Algicella marina]
MRQGAGAGMITGLRRLALLLAIGGTCAVLAGMGGWLHPAGDSLAAFRVQLLMGLVALSGIGVLLRARAAVAVAMAAALVAVAASWVTWWPMEVPQSVDLRLYSQNLRFTNAEAAAVVGGVRAFDADVVILQEVSETTLPVFEMLSSGYDVAELCAFGTVGGVAVLSRLPLAGPALCERGQGFLLVPLQTSAGPFSFGSAHLPWPWPHQQARQAAKVAGVVAGQEGRMIIAGDFNMVPWGASVQRIARASRTRVVPGLRLSFRRPDLWPGLPLDHVLVPEGVRARSQLLGAFGSDHLAVGTELELR